MFRWLLGIFSCMALLVLFIFQQTDFMSLLPFSVGPTAVFVGNKFIRFILNDVFALALVYALFPYRSYLTFAIVVQAIGFVFLFIPYIVLKLNYSDYQGPWLSFLHRLILNPTLILLLVPAFYYQKRQER